MATNPCCYTIETDTTRCRTSVWSVEGIILGDCIVIVAKDMLMAGSAAMLLLATPAAAQRLAKPSGTQKTQDATMSDVPHCARKLGTISVVDGDDLEMAARHAVVAPLDGDRAGARAPDRDRQCAALEVDGADAVRLRHGDAEGAGRQRRQWQGGRWRQVGAALAMPGAGPAPPGGAAGRRVEGSPGCAQACTASQRGQMAC